MKLSSFVPESQVLAGLAGGARDKAEIVGELIDHLLAHSPLALEGVPRDELLAAIMQREIEQTTAIGEGFAFPHARYPTLHRAFALSALCPDGVTFESLDGEMVHFLFLTLVPVDDPNLLLKTRAAYLKYLKDPAAQQAALAAPDAHAAWGLMDASGVVIDQDVLARHLMRQPDAKLRDDMTLGDAARLLHHHREDSLPILGRDDQFLGDLSCQDLFSFGMPNFFYQLKTIAFVRHMDPFEKYYRADQSVLLRDLTFNRTPAVVPSDATLMEVIFEMVCRGHHHIYVVDRQHLAGVIDRYEVIDRVLLV